MKPSAKRFILAMSALHLLGGPSWAAPLKVMSFNIRGDFDLQKASDSHEAWNALSNRHRRELVTETIDQFGPDLFGVQEAFRHQLADLRQALGGYEYYGVGRDDGREAGEHSAIFYRTERFDRVSEGSFWLSDSPSVAGSKHPDAANIRIASWIILVDRASGGRELFVLNSHWDHVSDAARRHAAVLIGDRLQALSAGRPAIVMGDMNAPERDAAIQILLGGSDPSGLRLVDSFREIVPHPSADEATYHDFRGDARGSRIDFILHTPELRATGAAIVRTKFGDRYPSDHFPVTAQLDWAKASSAGDAPTNPR
jgi:endonuclease/exonuclease/phosphatase family metal-dependent hydrolase